MTNMLLTKCNDEQVAEAECREIVGIIRGCIKTVTRGNKGSTPCPVYVKIAYILGLRVSSQHRYVGYNFAVMFFFFTETSTKYG